MDGQSALSDPWRAGEPRHRLFGLDNGLPEPVEILSTPRKRQPGVLLRENERRLARQIPFALESAQDLVLFLRQFAIPLLSKFAKLVEGRLNPLHARQDRVGFAPDPGDLFRRPDRTEIRVRLESCDAVANEEVEPAVPPAGERAPERVRNLGVRRAGLGDQFGHRRRLGLTLGGLHLLDCRLGRPRPSCGERCAEGFGQVCENRALKLARRARALLLAELGVGQEAPRLVRETFGLFFTDAVGIRRPGGVERLQHLLQSPKVRLP